ncbi:uncharacterized protein LOC123723342 [Papilio machaon]|uniref:uncharacterized protein LOC123723342 n=1 Tax=Papilio machaon TaxID=76193 RepID=UPI001E662EBA|nr:uncharacterized protein LOC123723342 [Papilio machaon]
MEGLRPPINLTLSGPSENFYIFKRKFLNYIEAAGLTEKTEERKIALFLNLAGDDAMDVYMTSMEKLKIKSLEKLLEQFEKHIKPSKNIIANSYKFFNMAQGEGETFEHYVTELKKQAKLCEFKEEYRLVKDMIVIGIKDKGVQERLLRESDLTLDQAMQFGRAAEIGKMQVGTLNEKKEIDTIHKQRVNYRKEKKNYRNNCRKCGNTHEPRKCPAFGKKCVLCNKLNHFAVMCRNKNIYRKKKQAYSLEKEENKSESASDNNYTIGSLNYIDNIKLQWRKKISILGLNIEFKLDTGADYVQPVIELPDCIRLNLLKRIDGVQSDKLSEKEKFIKDNKDIFQGLGTIGTYQIKIVDNAQPVVKPIRRIPLAIKDRLKETLNNYENRNVIERVEGPTEWCNNLVIVEKPDKSLRLCLDPKELNKCILRERYLIPSPEEIYNNLAEPLRNLLKKDIVWEWSEQQDKAFKELKAKLSNTPTLAVLNSKGPIVLQTDSSKSGMGACLLQNGNKMYIADYLSRNYIKNNAEIDPTTQELVHCFETDLAITDSKLEMLQKETANDADLMQDIQV